MIHFNITSLIKCTNVSIIIHTYLQIYISRNQTNLLPADSIAIFWVLVYLWEILGVVTYQNSVGGTLVCLSHLDTWRGCQPDSRL